MFAPDDSLIRPRSRWRALAAIVLLRDVPFWRKSRGRLIARGVVFFTYVYLLVLLMLLFFENRLLYPRTTFAQGWYPPSADLPVEDVELTSADGTRIHAWWSVPPGWKPQRGAILFSHGNGGNVSGRQGSMRAWLDALDRAILVYDYPGYGKSGGSPSEAGCYAAAEAAYRWLIDERHVPEGELIHVGESLGGAMATELASRHRCRMLILLSAFTSFPDMAQKTVPWLPARWLVTNRLDNLARIGNVGCPVFITHGTADELVPYWMGEKLFANTREPKRFLELPGHPHAHPHQREFYLAVREFLARTAK